ncbi:bifunctional pantoate--beta-alanine ligase/(d)CMP kinase [Thermosynechococcus sp. JY1334]|uniref:bifunctional pantoate--beta-alanine ligase/(d)CMP kinase n=1 Tax=unclassified Thermosynechococcus TaxID=2622553 RepID=UPI002672686B|nr:MULTISPECIES: bifunctional pantoate--beta-alanine ligase/(d)CMP kinase [unclassified Thermosynechococcus]MDR7897353.1 bifunctional pantoate--beta-alanine ligase/(d)CMP kinase [Thermosynechococcus sp. JY1332]MDR7904756.1 bifunctional pantoate--beta-alanine ligase/(d)CMP kinase [Thermosynechococcus sp. JY1334]WKT86984.1 bifunctional pantoate--beta-alanine ligase/(d)CMP kinase [Thermosynechococcus sp. JY1339]WNC52647.1 bifunctional pantoate--beta-alanine ligase/(d)CMP kinase [Thermosynechococcu
MGKFYRLTTTAGLQAALGTLPPATTLGFVPTMGALHGGHAALIQRARQECDVVVVSIFVNPLQFGPQEDLERYPRALEADTALCQQLGVDLLFVPSVAELYPAGMESLTVVEPPRELTERLCGRSRPGHFRGVATIVLKLLHLVQPDRAYFGQKDAQQLAIIRRCVADLNLDVEIIGCPIVRDADGLALSSRNQYLSAGDRATALALSQSLEVATTAFRQGCFEAKQLLEQVHHHLRQFPQLRLDYAELVHPQTLVPLERIETVGLLAIAGWVGQTRLIDNCLLDRRLPILAVDGPAGAGKSTVTRLAAQALGLQYLDTGAMYRAVTWWCLDNNIDLRDEPAVVEAIAHCQLRLESSDPPQPTRVWINDCEVSQAIRSLEVTQRVSQIAALRGVRRLMVQQQRAIGANGGIAAEGRDIGTHVFPEAGLKIFLTASPEERAQRRWQELQQQGQCDLSYEELLAQITARDTADQQRTYAPFRKAADAIEVCTDNLGIDEVVSKIVHLYRSRFPQP